MPWIRSGMLLMLLCTGYSSGYAGSEAFVGAAYHAHIKRVGGKLVPDEFTPTGYRWDDYDLVEVAADSGRARTRPAADRRVV